jgi:cyanophycin synthetase
VNPISFEQSNRLRVTECSVYRGPHLFSDLPMIRVQLDLGRLEQWPTDQIESFTARLTACLPGLANHGCSYGRPGGFIQRLKEGTWLGHVVEHVALELQNAAGCAVTRGKTRSLRRTPGVYNVMFAYEDERVGLLAGRYAVELVNSLLPSHLQGVSGLENIVELSASEDSFDLDLALAALKECRDKYALGPTTSSLVKEAERRGIPWLRLDGESSLIQLGYGRNQKRIRASITSQTSEIATEIAGDKDLTKQILSAAGLPVPEGGYARTVEGAVAIAKETGFPLVLKPLDGNHGRGVTTEIGCITEIESAFARAKLHSTSVIIEQQYEGADHRLLVVNGELVAAAKRIPAHVIGNGVSTIRQLIEAENLNPLRSAGHASFLTKIDTGEAVLNHLARKGRSLDTVPSKGERVFVQPTANLSSGGTAEDVTDLVHPENRMIAERAARAIGLDVAGIDFVAPDISRSVLTTGGGIIEVNACPGLRMHLRPSIGRPRNVARPILDYLFPVGQESRIPIIAITGTNGKTTTTRMVAHILKSAGLRVGMTTSTGIYIDQTRVAKADASGPKSAKMILRDPTVEVAVLETARGGILREGLGFDICDIGVVLNVAADHLGLRGVDTVEELADVKSVVVEAVRSRGSSVLNADDPLTADMAERAGGSIVYFSMREKSKWPDFLSKHIDEGGGAVVREQYNGRWEIVVYDSGGVEAVVPVNAIPATMAGNAEFNVANALAAVAIAHSHGIGTRIIREALSTFETSLDKCPGRMNIFEGKGLKVILDYVHNPHGLEAIGKLVNNVRPNHRRTIGLISAAGDRRDEDLRHMGLLASRFFDEIIFREDTDLRGRQRGEIAALMEVGALEGGFSPTHLSKVLDEEEAIEESITRAKPGDLVVLAVDRVEEAAKTVKSLLDSASYPELHIVASHTNGKQKISLDNPVKPVTPRAG